MKKFSFWYLTFTNKSTLLFTRNYFLNLPNFTLKKYCLLVGILITPFPWAFQVLKININLYLDWVRYFSFRSTLYLTQEWAIIKNLPSKKNTQAIQIHLKTGSKRFPFNNFKYFSLSFQSSFLLSFTLLVRYRFLVNI